MMAARIGWAAPWNIRSAIAQSAAEVGFELARRGHDVVVLRTETGEARDIPARAAPGDLRFLSDFDDRALQQRFDIVVGHIGDHYLYHGALLPRLDRISVLGIFHDLCNAHLMRGWVGDDQGQIRAIVRATYAGTPAAEADFRWDDLAYVVRHHPLIEWAASRTAGAVVHARHYEARVRAVCRGPVKVIPLAFDVAELPPPPPHFFGAMTVGVVGHANANKRIDQILLALSGSPFLREVCRVKVMGEFTPHMRDSLTAYAATLRIAPPVFTGWLSDDDLARQMRDVDVVSCLREPVIEGASASLIFALSSGRPTLISDHGSYADVPDDAALKCLPGREAMDIMLHLERLARTPSLGPEIGARGKAFTATRHRATAYADALELMLEQVMAGRAKHMARIAFRDALSNFGLQPNDEAVARSLGRIDAMCGEL